MHTAQSMHSSGSITSMFGPSRKQSTGQTSTQSVYLHLMQDSVTTWVMKKFPGTGVYPQLTADPEKPRTGEARAENGCAKPACSLQKAATYAPFRIRRQGLFYLLGRG